MANCTVPSIPRSPRAHAGSLALAREDDDVDRARGLDSLLELVVARQRLDDAFGREPAIFLVE